MTTAGVLTAAWDLGFRMLRPIDWWRRAVTNCSTAIESWRRRFWAGSITSTGSRRPLERRDQTMFAEDSRIEGDVTGAESVDQGDDVDTDRQRPIGARRQLLRRNARWQEQERRAYRHAARA